MDKNKLQEIETEIDGIEFAVKDALLGLQVTQKRLQDLQMQFNQQQGQPKQAQPTASKFQLSYFPPDANYEIRGSSVYMNGRNIGNIGGSRGENTYFI